MKIKNSLLTIGGTLLLAAPALLAQNNLVTNRSTGGVTNIPAATITNAPIRNHQGMFEGEQMVLPPGLKERMRLTDTQEAELRPIEDDFAKTSQEFRVANQPRIDAAHEAGRRARASKDTAQIQISRTQLQQVWSGLQSYRTAAVDRIKPLLTPDQLKILEDPQNQWRENHVHEANNPSAN